MKKVVILILSAVSLLSAQGFEMSFKDIKGVSLGYSYRPTVIFGNHSSYRMFPMHFFLFNIDGMGEILSSSSYDSRSGEKTFGGFGFVLGISAEDKYSSINSKDRYYSGYRRVVGLNNEKGDMMFIGGDIRFMIPFPFSSDVSVINSYVNVSIESGFMGLSYTSESGGFDNYVKTKTSEGGYYIGLNLGAKFFIFDFYAGCGGLFGLYNKGIFLKSADKERDVSNEPDETNHFVGQFGVGVMIDLHAKTDY